MHHRPRETPIEAAAEADIAHLRAHLLEHLIQLVAWRCGNPVMSLPAPAFAAGPSALEDVRHRIIARQARPGLASSDQPMDASFLRELYRDVRSTLAASVRGQDDAVRAIALAAVVHVGTDAPGQRLLMLGPSGVGKSTLCRATAEMFGLPAIHVDALDLTGPGWGGAPSIGDVIEAVLRGADPASYWARRAVIVIDEIHHVRLYHGLTGNSYAKRAEILNSLLAVAGGGVGIQLGESNSVYRADDALVVFSGAFTGLVSAAASPTVEELAAYGLPHELANRMNEIVALRPLGAAAIVEILQRWPAILELQALAQSLGTEIQVAPETYRRIGRAVADGVSGATVRTGAGWLLATVRQRLALALDDQYIGRCIISPDCLTLPRSSEAAPSGDRGLDGPEPTTRTSWS